MNTTIPLHIRGELPAGNYTTPEHDAYVCQDFIYEALGRVPTKLTILISPEPPDPTIEVWIQLAASDEFMTVIPISYSHHFIALAASRPDFLSCYRLYTDLKEANKPLYYSLISQN